MKPTTPNTTPLADRGEREALSPSAFPITDYAFQTRTPATTVQSASSAEKVTAEARTFRAISRQFIEVGARQEYFAEALVFAWIALTAAGPLGVLVHQLTTMMIRYQ